MASIKEEIKAGLIILISLVLLSGFIILIGGSQFFEKLDQYYVKVMDAAGLEVGAQVKLGGVKIGSVLSIKTPNGPGQPIIIEIGIKNGTTLYKGTQALITQVGLVEIYTSFSRWRRRPMGKFKQERRFLQRNRSSLAELWQRLKIYPNRSTP